MCKELWLLHSAEANHCALEQGFENLVARIARLSALDPLAISVTWGAGGSTKDRSLELAGITQAPPYGLETMLHLTCTNMQEGLVDEVLRVRLSIFTYSSVEWLLTPILTWWSCSQSKTSEFRTSLPFVEVRGIHMQSLFVLRLFQIRREDKRSGFPQIRASPTRSTSFDTFEAYQNMRPTSASALLVHKVLFGRSFVC